MGGKEAAMRIEQQTRYIKLKAKDTGIIYLEAPQALCYNRGIGRVAQLVRAHGSHP